MRNIKYFIFGLMFTLFFGVLAYMPLLQYFSPKLQAKKLGGAKFSDAKPNYWAWAWLDGSFQKKYQNYLKNENDVVSTFVRLNTQLDFNLFGEIPHEDLIMGKANNIIPKSSWTAAVGKDFIGKEKVEEKARKLKVIDNYLNALGKKLLILTPPNKSSAMWDHLPTYYRNHPIGDRNRTHFQEALLGEKLEVIDFSHFVNANDEGPYPLYPQGGLHWTYYGYSLAADSIRNYIVNQFGWDIPEMEWRDRVEVKKMERHSDRELYATANFFREPTLDSLPYPNIKYNRDSADLIKVLGVGDSYYKLLYDYGIHKGLFHEDSPFWYYASTLFPPVYRNGKKLNNSGDIDVLEVLADKDLVILTVVEGNLKKFGWGWVERMYKAIEASEKSND